MLHRHSEALAYEAWPTGFFWCQVSDQTDATDVEPPLHVMWVYKSATAQPVQV